MTMSEQFVGCGCGKCQYSNIIGSTIYEYMIMISDWEAVVKLSDDFNGADLRNVCTEAGK